MKLSLKKVKALWDIVYRENETYDLFMSKVLRLGVDESVVRHSDGILKCLDEIWDYSVPEQLKNSTITAHSKGCAVGINDGGSAKVEVLQYEQSQDLGCDEDRKRCHDLIWGQRFVFINKGRDARYRIASNASGGTAYETFNTTVVQQNPDPWIFSYNFPWHVIQFMKNIHDGNQPQVHLVYQDFDVAGDQILDKKFAYKYLWMVSDSEVLPICSLRSFYNLENFFSEVLGQDLPTFRKSFGMNADSCRWEQGLGDFKIKWKELSDKIVVSLVGGAQFNEELRKKIALFLFAVSLMGSSSRDIGTLLNSGNRAVILYGPPGTGKTYTAKNYIREKLSLKEGESKNERGEMRIVQFHPNYSYQDFIGGIFPKLDESENGNLKYDLKSGVFRDVCVEAAKKENKDKSYYLLIDEINRAELSAVFGELMYCLEYRGEKVSIPHFEDFQIPPNVFIIGTMNNTDKSLVGFDMALRRRFGFLKIGPDMTVLERTGFVLGDKANTCISREFADRARELNKKLGDKNGAFALPEEKLIGHAYFLKIRDFCEKVKCAEDEGVYQYVIDSLAMERLWNYHLDPLLEEYLGSEYETRKMELESLSKEFCKEFA